MATMFLTGHLGADARVLSTVDGKQYLSMSVAESRGKNGQQTDWYTVTYSITSASTLPKYLTKGTLVEVVGRPEISGPWQGQDGQYHANIKVFANSIKLLHSTATGGEVTASPVEMAI